MGTSQRIKVVRDLREWTEAGQPAVLATVVASDSSAPRGIGAQLAVTVGGLWTGALSGGCAESEVLAVATQLLDRSGPGAERAGLHMTLTREQLGAGGPMCGATLDVVVERVDAELLDALQGAATPQRTVVLHRAWSVTDDASGALIRTRSAAESEGAAGAGRSTGATMDVRRVGGASVIDWSIDGDGARLTWRIEPAPRLVVAGAGDVATELLRLAGRLGWRTTLLDPRTAFVRQTLRGTNPDEVLESWPDDAGEQLAIDAACACVAAAHVDRIDTPFLELALRSDAFYVGSIGSRVVQHVRSATLAASVGEDAAARHHGPAGLDLGGADAAEIALSIIAEAVAAANGRSGGPLRSSSQPIRAH